MTTHACKTSQDGSQIPVITPRIIKAVFRPIIVRRICILGHALQILAGRVHEHIRTCTRARIWMKHALVGKIPHALIFQCPTHVSGAHAHIGLVVLRLRRGGSTHRACRRALWRIQPGGPASVHRARRCRAAAAFQRLRNGHQRLPGRGLWPDLPLPRRAALFHFGSGISYTRFETRQLRLSSATIGPCERVTVTVSVTTVGNKDGEEDTQFTWSA
jgi:hypothetical protein